MAISYKAAIRWIVDNDDTEWALDPNGYMSVTAIMVADIYGVVEEKVRKDIIKALEIKRREARVIRPPAPAHR